MQCETNTDQTPEEQYESWKANSGYLYDRLIVNQLAWPALSFQWLPQYDRVEGGTIFRYIYTTNTSGEQQQYIYVAEMFIPNLREFESECLAPKPLEKLLQTIQHPGEVNRIRYNRANPKLLATKTVEGVINIYERGLDYPVQLLTGHTQEGYALDWKRQGLLSGSYDCQVIVWRDIDKPSVFQGLCPQKVEDTKWIDQNSFLCVTDGGMMSSWDIRQKQVQETFKAHLTDAYTLDVNAFNNNMILTGGQDKTVRIWDRRCITKKLYSFDGHNDTVMRVEWSPHDINIFCSGSIDHKVMVWDVLRVGSEVPKDDTNSGPNELLVKGYAIQFTHSGHRGSVSDLGWSPHQKLIGSVEEEFNTLQFYQMAQNFTDIEYVEDFQYQKAALML